MLALRPVQALKGKRPGMSSIPFSRMNRREVRKVSRSGKRGFQRRPKRSANGSGVMGRRVVSAAG